MDQIDQYGPPPNPAKMTDSRFRDYQLEYGTESWELDALEPRVMTDLIRENVTKYIDQEAWDDKDAEREDHRLQLQDIIDDLPEE